jgi:hypothetical protein
VRVHPDNFTRFFYFIAVLSAVSLAVVWAFNGIVKAFWREVPIWIETPSVVAVLVALYALFDRHLWSWPVFRMFRVVDFPDLRGRWTGRVRSTDSREAEAVLEIDQTASKVIVSLYTEGSQSVSQIADFKPATNGALQLHYSYRNEPAPHSPGSMQIHVGTGALTYFEDMNVLEGEYYTGRGRQTYGTMRFQFDSRTVLRRFRA